MARVLLTLLLTALAAALAVVVVLRALARRLLRTRPRPWQLAPGEFGADAEPFSIALAESQLRGWLLRATAPAGAGGAVAILAHGWQSNAAAMLPWAAPLLRAGYDCAIYDALGHGQSDPTPFTSLRHFRQELRAVMAYVAARRPGRRLVLVGHSMGGAASILAAEDADDVDALILAGAPTDPLEITREFFDARGLPGALLVLALRPFWQRIIGEAPATLRPVDAIARLRVPVLILHGDADAQVDVRHADELAAACPGARLVRFPAGRHNDLPAQPGFDEALVGFLGSRR